MSFPSQGLTPASAHLQGLPGLDVQQVDMNYGLVYHSEINKITGQHEPVYHLPSIPVTLFKDGKLSNNEWKSTSLAVWRKAEGSGGPVFHSKLGREGPSIMHWGDRQEQEAENTAGE